MVGLGFVSLFTDVSSEAILPLLPAFLTTLGASNAFIGVIEGTAEFVASVLKHVIGRWADRLTRLKPLVLFGYGISTVARPRDALIANATEPAQRARAFGFHHGMDHAGAAIGTLLGAGLLWWLGGGDATAASSAQLRVVFAWAAVRVRPGGRLRAPLRVPIPEVEVDGRQLEPGVDEQPLTMTGIDEPAQVGVGVAPLVPKIPRADAQGSDAGDAPALGERRDIRRAGPTSIGSPTARLAESYSDR